jgi:hypothetical protein
VVRYAKELFENGNPNKGIQARAFEKVFAVFDRDDHQTYFDALTFASTLDGRLLNDLKRPVEFRAIASVPSFELWLLLHYENIQAPIHRDEVMRRLKGYIPNYDKGAIGAFAATRTQLDTATQRAEFLAQRFTPYTEPAPFTGITELVKLLISLRS